MKPKKTYEKIISGRSDTNIDFAELQNLLIHMGFDHKNTVGDHFIYSYKKLPSNINIQPQNGKAKAYQVKQVRNFLISNNIKI